MTKGKVIAAKVVIGIVCVILICGVIFMGVMLGIDLSTPNIPIYLTTSYDDLPNVMGDDGVYVSKNFFIENNLEIPEYVNFYEANRNNVNEIYIEDKDAFYTGRAYELDYSCESYSNDRPELSVWIGCSPKIDDHTSDLMIETSLKEEGGEIFVTRYTYYVNFNRNAYTSKKCQLTFVVKIEHEGNFNLEYDVESLYQSMLDNVVYRNV